MDAECRILEISRSLDSGLGEPRGGVGRAAGARAVIVSRILLWGRGLCVASGMPAAMGGDATIVPESRIYLAGATCSMRKTPFLLAVTMSSKPSPLKSATTNWVPMPLWSSISRGVNVILPSAPRAASNQ